MAAPAPQPRAGARPGRAGTRRRARTGTPILRPAADRADPDREPDRADPGRQLRRSRQRARPPGRRRHRLGQAAAQHRGGSPPSPPSGAARRQDLWPTSCLRRSAGRRCAPPLRAGNPAAEYEIGVRYSEGRGVPADLELAAHWFERAANHGLAPAQYRLGSLYEKGQGVKKDLNKARSLYLQAADKGNAKAIHNLAVLYAEGIDGKPDYGNAAQWFRKAAMPRRRRQPVQSRHPLRPRHRRRPEPRRILQMVRAGGRSRATRTPPRSATMSRPARPAVARRGAACGADLHAPIRPPDEAMNVKAPAGGWDKATSSAPAKPAATPRRKQQQS